MIVIVTTGEHRYTHNSLRETGAVEAEVISYDELESRSQALPFATYVFTDADRLLPVQAYRISGIHRALRNAGMRVLNDPVRMLSRFGLSRALYRAGINMFDAYRVEDRDEPRRWPVFLRVEGTHSRPISGLLNNRAELDEAIERALQKGMPIWAMLIIEYAAEPVRPGLFRKLSAFRVGDRMIGYTCVHDDQWLVKYGKPGIATDDLYEEEYEMVANGPFNEVLRPIFDIAGIEYGRVDFGLVDGQPQIYEINSNPDLKLGSTPEETGRRQESSQLFKANYLAAVRAIDTAPSKSRLKLVQRSRR